MPAELVINPESDRDIERIVVWHDDQEPGLGEALLESLEAQFVAICRSPRVFSHYRDLYRRSLLEKFYFAVVYTFDPDINTVTVFAVYHTSRDREKVLKHLP